MQTPLERNARVCIAARKKAKTMIKDHDYFEQAFGINKTGFPQCTLLDKMGLGKFFCTTFQ